MNGNSYDSKSAVYLDGGPKKGSAAGLDDGEYYVQVTDPRGTPVLGKSNGTAVTVVDGEFAHCYQLADLVYSAASDYTTKGYDTTPNNGGEYKVWISKEADFDPQKTDNFKVVDVVVPPAESLSVSKDATPSLDRTFGWNISKDVDKTTVKQIGGSATFN